MTHRSTSSPASGNAKPSIVVMLLPIIASLFVAYLVIGIAMPVIPLHVHQGLGLSAFVVGLVAGAQFTASLLSRFWSGNFADSHGGRRSIISGLLIAAASGLLYFLSIHFVKNPVQSVAILLVGRAVLGAAESFIISGALVWGIALAGPENTGRVMAWVGAAMYIAFAVGAPSGTALYAGFGFTAISLVTLLLPLGALAFVLPRQADAGRSHAKRSNFGNVVRAVWAPGVGLAFSSAGFGAMTTFVVLLFVQRGWPLAWLALTVFAGAFVAARLLLGHLTDRMGGAKIALVCTLMEAIGLALIWLAPWAPLALFGACVTGFGYSLAYPGFGVEAVRRVPAESRGIATGTYTAFLDLTLGVANPILGLIANSFGLSSVFLASSLVVMCSAIVAMLLMRVPKKQITAPLQGAEETV